MRGKKVCIVVANCKFCVLKALKGLEAWKQKKSCFAANWI